MTGREAGPLKDRMAYQATLLGMCTLAAVALLLAADLATRDAIAEREREDLRASLARVVPAELASGDLLAARLDHAPPGEAPRAVYRALDGGRVRAVAFRVTGAGYAGPMDILMAVDAAGTVLGVRVLSHTETPGLGDLVEAAKADWIHGFAGRSLGAPPEDAWAVRKDGGAFDQFTGATVTPRAVVTAVRDGLLWFRRHRAALLAPRPGEPPPVGAPSRANGRGEGAAPTATTSRPGEPPPVEAGLLATGPEP